MYILTTYICKLHMSMFFRFNKQIDSSWELGQESERIAKEKKAKLEAEEAETRKLIEEIKARQESAKKN